jgi:hypothetical protein
MRKTIPSTVASKRRKYLGINLTMEVKYLSSDKYKILKKAIGEWDNHSCWENIMKIAMLRKATTDSMQTPSKE